MCMGVFLAKLKMRTKIDFFHFELGHVRDSVKGRYAEKNIPLVLTGIILTQYSGAFPIPSLHYLKSFVYK